MGSPAEEFFLRDVLNIPEDVHRGDFKVDLSDGFEATRQRVDEYVVTDQLQEAFRKALGLVKAAVRDGKSEAAYLHGSFGSGKSHFMTVLHGVLQGDAAAWAKPKLQEVIAEHVSWLRGRRFMMVPYHLIGAVDLDTAILGGYVVAARAQGLSTPPVYRSDALLADARRQREFLDDDAKFIEWLGSGAAPQPAADDDLEDLDSPAGADGWSAAALDHAFAASAGDPRRDALVSGLLAGPMSAYAVGARGAKDAFLPLENGLAVMSRHARQHGFDGLVLFLDELILWLQAHMSNQEMVNTEVSKLVKLIESGDADRPVPIISFISRQRDLSKLVGEDVLGADVKNLERQVQYLAERFTLISLEDRNLPAIIKERVLKPKPGAEGALDAAFAGVESANATVRDVLLDAHGATHADWSDFRDVYPLSPALLNVLVALSGALQRERTGLRLLTEMLRLRRDDMRVGQIIPLGDLWDVLSDGIGEAFTDRLRQDAEAAVRFHGKAYGYLVEKYGAENDERLKADDRIVKTLILSALAPDVTALTRLTGTRLAALNLGSIRSRTVPPGTLVVNRLRELIGGGFGEIRADGELDPVFTLHLSDLDIEPLLEQVGDQDNLGARRIWVKSQLWKAFGVTGSGAFVSERELVWRGSRRTVELVFENVRDEAALPVAQFRPSVEGRVRLVLDYPFDEPGKFPSDDAGRVAQLQRDGLEADTLVWLPNFLSAQKSKQLGRLLKIRYLLERDRLGDYAGHLSSDERIRVQHHLQAQQGNLTSQLTSVLQQLYGISSGDEGNIGAEVPERRHVLSLNPDYREMRLHGGAGFDYNLLSLADGLFAKRYPKHPDFDTAGSRKAVTTGELKTVLGWVTRAMEDGSGRVVVDRDRLALLRRVVHPLEIGEVHDGPMTISTEWKRRIEQQAAQHGVGGDFAVEDIRTWIEELGWTGLDRTVANLIIACYALLSDRAWVLNGKVEAQGPELERIGSGWALRAQPLPTEEEFAAARTRAAKIFGVSVPQPLFGRNVARLAGQVRQRTETLEIDVNGVRRALERHAEALGLSGPHAPRARCARHAADLLARLSATHEDTTLVREMAAAAYDVTDEELGSAITSAPTVLAALDNADWPVLAAVRGFAGRGDGIGERAERLIDEISQAADADEFSKSLAPVLNSAKRRAVTLIAEAGRQAQTVPPPVAPPPDPDASGASRASGEQISLNELDQPSGPADPSGRVPRAWRRRVDPSRLETALAEAVNDLQNDIRAHIAEHPHTAVEIVWHPVDPQTPAGGDGD